ncbi:MAG: alpha/beta hydrolase [Rudaea sp.]|uniref:alpha/beta hydrolase n=1 Tax=unclassified Rudaea TaxID=2627037 RepID=UPI001485BFCF|nr:MULTISPECIES: alpha/beta hydrolase [unclassified Rudaea]MBN8887799.1 alpha/beta hydrolase [Rudaea sp.]
MHVAGRFTLFGVIAAAVLSLAVFSSARAAPAEPTKHAYREVGGKPLNAFVFQPAGNATTPRSAILLFHGGGWAAGSAEWTFGSAQRFADLGLVAIAVDYRLSNETTTPADSLEDTCAALAWARAHADELRIDTQRIAGYGVSAGGQLLGAAATGRCADAGLRPSALLMVSPALDVAADGWFEKLLRGRGKAKDYSPLEHVDASTPPALVIQGAADTLTPLRGAQKFCTAMRAAGKVCELAVYENVGHLLTRNLKNQENDFDPDPKASADGVERQKRFLREHGFLPTASTTSKK